MCFTFCIRKKANKNGKGKRGSGRKHTETADGSMRPSKGEATEQMTDATSTSTKRAKRDATERKSKSGRDASREDKKETKDEKKERKEVKPLVAANGGKDGQEGEDPKVTPKEDETKGGEPGVKANDAQADTKQAENVDGAKIKGEIPKPGRALKKVHVKERTNDDYCFLDNYSRIQIRRSLEQQRKSAGQRPISRVSSCKAFR